MIVGSLLLTIGAVALLVLGLLDGSDPYLVGSIAASLLAAIALVAGRRRASAAGADAAGADAAGADAEEEPVSGDPASDGDGDRDGRDGEEDPIAAAPDGPGPGGHEPITVVIPAARAGADKAAVRDEARERRPSVAVQEAVIPSQGGAMGRGRELMLDDGPDVPDNPGDVPDNPGDLPDNPGDEEPPDEPVAQQVPAGDAARVARMTNDVLVIDGRPRYHLAGCVHLLGRTSERLPVHEAVELGFTPCGLCEPDSALLAEARGA